VGELPSLIIFFPLVVPGVERNTWAANVETLGIQLRTNYALSSADLQFNIARCRARSRSKQWAAIEGEMLGGTSAMLAQIYILD
jgi:hypothetical protein